MEFSIIIPTYNSASTLKACLNSIVSQTHTNYEILIIDNLSIDNTVEIGKSFNNARIKIFSEKDKGIYDAMNKGISLAKGDWIYFMGSDDSFYSLKTLQEVSKNLTELDIVYGDVYSSRFNGRYDGEFDEKKIRDKNICHQAIFFKKAVFNTIGVYNTKYKSHADWDHNLRWFLSEKIRKNYINLVIANYADGGFSSLNSDFNFHQIKNWKIALLTKNEISFLNKLRIIKYEITKAIKMKRKNDLFFILKSLPKFLI